MVPIVCIGETFAKAQEAHALVRGLLAKRFGDNIAQSISIQYGGLMKPENAAALLNGEAPPSCAYDDDSPSSRPIRSLTLRRIVR